MSGYGGMWFAFVLALVACGTSPEPESAAAPDEATQGDEQSQSETGTEPDPQSTPSVDEASAATCTETSSELQTLVAQIDEEPDMLHLDFTPAVHALSERGAQAACAVLELLHAPDTFTRLHAQRVLEGVLMRRAGWRPGQGYADAEAEPRVRTTLQEIAFAHDASEEERSEGATRWRQWVEDVIATNRTTR